MAQTQLQTSLFGLARLLNVDPKRPIELADQVSFFETPAIEVDQSLEAAYTNRPEMKALAAQPAAGGIAKASRPAKRAARPSRFEGYWAYRACRRPA